MNYASSIREANRNPSIVFHREKINIGRRRFFYRSIDRQSTVSCSCRRGNRALYCVISPPDRHIRLSTRAKLSPDYICFALVRFVRLTFSIEFVISLEGERIRLDVSYRVQAYNIFSSDAVPMFFKSDKIFCAGKSVCFVRSVFSRNALGHDSANVSKL